jgi:tetratricopeptide (TPR) repeat protein
MLAAASIVVMVLVGLAISQVVQSKANRALGAKNRELARANQRAEARFDLARDAIGSLKSVVTQDELLKNEELSGLRNKLLSTVAGFYERLEPLLQDQEDRPARTLLAQSYEDLGRLITDIGRFPDALAAQEKALSIRRQLNASRDAGPADARNLARSLIDVGDLAAFTPTKEEGRTTKAYTEARKIAERLITAYPDAAENQELLAQCLLVAGRAALGSGPPGQERASIEGLGSGPTGQERASIELFHQALAIREMLTSLHPELESNQKAQAQVLYHIAIAERGDRNTFSDMDSVVRCYRQALEIQDRLVKAHPESVDYRLDEATTLNAIGNLLSDDNHRIPEALQALASAKRILRELSLANPAATRIQLRLAATLDDIAWACEETGDVRGALAAVRENQIISDRLAPAHPYMRIVRVNQAINYRKAGVLLAKQGDKVEARESLKRAQSLLDDYLKENPADKPFEAQLAQTLNELGRASTGSRQYAEALASHRRAVALRRPIARSPDDQYNLACEQTLLAGAASRPESGVSAEQARAEADLAVADLRKSIEAGYRDFANMQTDSDLDPIRSRDDFRLLMLDVAFPTEPFAVAR